MMIRVSFGIYKGVPFVAEASGLQHFRPDLRSGCSRMPRLPHSCCHVSPVQRARWPSQETNDLFGPKEKMRAWQGLI